MNRIVFKLSVLACAVALPVAAVCDSSRIQAEPPDGAKIIERHRLNAGSRE